MVKSTDNYNSNGLGQSWVEHAESTRKNLLETPEDVEQSTLLSIVVFKIGREYYGTPIRLIKEIVKASSIAPIPQSPDYISGVANIRGNIMAIIDFQLRIQRTHNKNQRPYIMVLSDENLRSGILIDEVPETIEIFENKIDTESSVVSNLSANDPFIKGLIRYEGKMIILVDVEKLIT